MQKLLTVSASVRTELEKRQYTFKWETSSFEPAPKPKDSVVIDSDRKMWHFENVVQSKPTLSNLPFYY